MYAVCMLAMLVVRRSLAFNHAAHASQRTRRRRRAFASRELKGRNADTRFKTNKHHTCARTRVRVRWRARECARARASMGTDAMQTPLTGENAAPAAHRLK